MTNLNIAKLYLANNSTATVAQIDTAVTDGTANTAVQALSTAAFVEAAYQAAFGRAADAEGLAYWSNEIDVNGMAKDDAFMTALNYGATVYVAPTAETPLVIGTETFTAATVSATDDVVVAAAKATAEAAASSASVGSVAAAVVDVVDTTTATAAAVVIDAADAAADAAAAGSAISLTVASETAVMTLGNNVVTATAGTLNTGDVIIDSSTTDSDILNVTYGDGTIAPTIKNVEAVNLTWNSNADLLFDATNTAGNTYNLTGTALAFSGAAKVDEVGSNTVVADSTITGLLTVEEIISSTIDAGSASTLALTLGTVTTAGAKTTADVTINGNIGAATAMTNTVEELTITATTDATVTLAAAGAAIIDSLTIAGTKNTTVVAAALTGEKVINELTAGTLTLKAGDTGAFASKDLSADVIEFTGAVTAVTAADNQNFLVQTAANATLASFASAAGVTNATVNLESKMGTTAITSLDTTAIGNLNLDVKADTTISALKVDAANNLIVTGDSDLVISAMTASAGAISIDASDSTGEVTIATTTVDVATGILGSTTAVNDITVANVDAKAKVITGSANDIINALVLEAGIIDVEAGAGNDTINLDASTIATETLTEIIIDGGAGTSDVLKIDATGDISTIKSFNVTNVEKLSLDTGATVGASMISGKTFEIKEDTGANATTGTLNVLVTNAAAATAITTDLSTLTWTNGTTNNFVAVAITGLDGVADTITGTKLNDTFTSTTGADVYTLGAGNDTLAIDHTADSREATMNTFSGFTAGDSTNATLGGDLVDFAGTSVFGAITSTTVAGSIANGTGSETAFAEANATGMMTLTGVDSDQLDTLAEMVDAAQVLLAVGGGTTLSVLGFEFSGNTYVISEGTATAGNITDDSIIELTGVTGLDGFAATGTATLIELA